MGDTREQRKPTTKLWDMLDELEEVTHGVESSEIDCSKMFEDLFIIHEN